jgi:Protocatechuate 3,4-dioxygenase beta subunit N terminal
MKAAAEPARVASQRAITAEIARIVADHQGKDEPQPLLDHPPYRSSQLRRPKSLLVCVDPDRAYLSDSDLDADRLLSALDASRRQTLICAAENGGFRFDIRLQGADETVFLAYRGDSR